METIEQFENLTDPNFIIALSKELIAVPVLFFVLVVMIIFYLVIRMQGKIINTALNGKKE